MNNHAQEHLQNSDKLMADSVRRDRHAIAHEAAEYIEAVLERLVYTQERIGELASVPFEPKDYTKPESTVTLDKPASKPDAFEQALIDVALSSQNTVPKINEDAARVLVEQSLKPDMIANGLSNLEDFANRGLADAS
ncbi:hypothetical protein EB077_00745 [bacterium]|nr:hypothetical protein [bacterium]NDC93828.1 hypothetical protein [bacterium]